MILAAEGANILALVLGSGAFLAAMAAWFKAPTEKDVSKRGMSVAEAAEIRATLNTTLDQVQEEKASAQTEARTLRAEVEKCRGDCDVIRDENRELKRDLGRAERKVDELEARVAELQRQLETLRGQ